MIKTIYIIKYKILNEFKFTLNKFKKEKKFYFIFVKVRIKSKSTIENKCAKLLTHHINYNFIFLMLNYLLLLLNYIPKKKELYLVFLLLL